ncbi:hypothetical protein K8I61_05210, partial [bacterium]|nr:hypothetical protein [bacterium]
MRSFGAERLSASVEILLLGLLIYLPIALGGVAAAHRAPAFVLAAILAVLAVIEARARIGRGDTRILERLRDARPAFYAGAAFLAVGAVQLLPLPRALARWLAFDGRIVPGAFMPMHPAPEIGLRHLLTWMIAMLVFATIVLLYERQTQIVRLTRTLAAVGVGEALYGLIEWMSGHQHIFAWAKTSYTDVATGTFVNRNHYAAYLAMALGLVAGAMLFEFSRRRELRREDAGAIERLGFLAFAAVVMLGAMVASASRAALASLIFALALAGITQFRGKNRRAYFAVLAGVALVAV